MAKFKDAEEFLKVDRADLFEDKRKFFGLFGHSRTNQRAKGSKTTWLLRLWDRPGSRGIQPKGSGGNGSVPAVRFQQSRPGEVDLYYTESGSMVALQIVEYQNYNPHRSRQ